MTAAKIDQVVIVGRDVSLWLAASVIRSALGSNGVKVTAVELPSQLCEHDVCASQPALEALHHRLRIDEAALLAATGGVFSLGQNFVDASKATPSFFHAYGTYGAPIDQKAFLPFWLMARHSGLQAAFEDFSLTAAAAKHGRMLIPDAATETYGRTDYAYHLPARGYARWLKNLAIRRGVTAIESSAVRVVFDADGRSIAAVEGDSGNRIEGQLFIDAAGSDAPLMSALGVKRETWRGYFAADRQLAASAAPFSSIPPYAEVRAWSGGWLSLIPDRTRTHVVQVYSSSERSDEEALQIASGIAGLPLHDASVTTSDPGRLQTAWVGNCVALGAAACTFDAIHGVDVQALQLGLAHLLSLFPAGGEYAAERAEYNRIARQAFERLRDFQSAFYVTNRYPRSSFWTRARSAGRSAELTHKIDTFRARGEVPLYENESFALESWQALLIGQGIVPESYDPAIERTSPETMKHEFRRILAFIKDKVQEQTTHDFYLENVCTRPR
ncbi:MAG TPA: tryptophan 7-halogenase [Povalibacter sp.]|uniref:tryptophan 7-halogenase n=1 Tax=Povalibacter sp. TaxID=1962978 RepID=UPI002CBF383C|nr:tryptophan 7-halogenase [Povalibacter sp.]HMN46614.1 tryptophan 7-halogenase [Povalibacter sp.]